MVVILKENSQESSLGMTITGEAISGVDAGF